MLALVSKSRKKWLIQWLIVAGGEFERFALKDG